ncbi:MAG: oxidase [Gammaproteobacteria bacterium]
MSILNVFHPSSPGLPNKLLTHHDDIVATLAEQGVRFMHQPHELRVRPGTGQDEVLDACREPLDRLMTEHGCAAYALLNRDGVDAAQFDLRNEHVHGGDEVFAVISGRAQVTLRVGEYVYGVLCEKGDVLIVPAQVRRWIDLGETPFCLALRLFHDEQAKVPRFTGDSAALEFAGIDEF